MQTNLPMAGFVRLSQIVGNLKAEATGRAPQKPASGKLMLRIPPEVHTAASIAAQAAGKSLNQWAAETLKNAAMS